MKKLNKYIETEKNNGFTIIKDYYFYEGPGNTDYKKECVILNNRFIWGHIEDFDENKMISVLYHEIGHLNYFKKNPIDKDDFTDEYKTNSEYFAFSFALMKLREMALKDDYYPLRAAILDLEKRIEQIKLGNFKNEGNSMSHINALLKLYESEIFNTCCKYLDKLDVDHSKK